jgi:hypothetical protein
VSQLIDSRDLQVVLSVHYFWTMDELVFSLLLIDSATDSNQDCPSMHRLFFSLLPSCQLWDPTIKKCRADESRYWELDFFAPAAHTIDQ